MSTPRGSTPASTGAPDARNAARATGAGSVGDSPQNVVKSGPRPWLRSLGNVFGLGRQPAPSATAPAVPAATSAGIPASEAVPAPPSALDALYELAPRLRAVWAADTSTEPGLWSPANPALGQSAVTACVVQDVMGGTIVEAVMTTPAGATVSHFCNDVDGLAIDLTPAEFPPGTTLTTRVTERPGFRTMRDYLLSLPGVAGRYEVLRGRLAKVPAAA